MSEKVVPLSHEGLVGFGQSSDDNKYKEIIDKVLLPLNGLSHRKARFILRVAVSKLSDVATLNSHT